LFFETNLEKNILTPDNKLFPQKKKKNFKKTSAKLYSLSSQPVRKNEGVVTVGSMFNAYYS